jgi:hypothetical protein
MLTRFLVLVSMFAFGHAFAQEVFPATMKGQWKSSSSGAVGETVIELVKLQDPARAEVKVTFKDVTTRPPSEGGSRCSLTEPASAVREGETWQIRVKNFRCASFSVSIRRVEGKQRFEGEFANDVGTHGPIFYEWE